MKSIAYFLCKISCKILLFTFQEKEKILWSSSSWRNRQIPTTQSRAKSIATVFLVPCAVLLTGSTSAFRNLLSHTAKLRQSKNHSVAYQILNETPKTSMNPCKFPAARNLQRSPLSEHSAQVELSYRRILSSFCYFVPAFWDSGEPASDGISWWRCPAANQVLNAGPQLTHL